MICAKEGCNEPVIKSNEWGLCKKHLRSKRLIEYNKKLHKTPYGDYKPFYDKPYRGVKGQ